MPWGVIYLFFDHNKNLPISLKKILPNHDDGEIENVPGVSEVCGGVSDETEGNDPHEALGSEDDGEDDFNLLKEVVGGITVTIGEGGENS